MRWLTALVSLAAVLPFGASAANKAAKSKLSAFDEFHPKALASSPLKLNDAAYKKLTSAPRDHATAVLLTALDARFGCHLCNDFQPEWDVIGKSWARGDKAGESRLILGTLDFADGRETFMALGLQTAPVLLLFPPTEGPHAVNTVDPIRYDFTSGPSAELVRNWIARQLPDRPHPEIYRPINWFAWGVTAIIGLATVGAAAKLWPYVLPVLQSRNAWAAISLLGILLFTSGHMFNQIRKAPYVAADGRGGVAYFAPGFQNQYGLETQIIAFLYGLLAFATISLAVKAPREKNPKTQQIMVIAWGALLFLIYSFLLLLFRGKNGGYPFKLPPFV